MCSDLLWIVISNRLLNRQVLKGKIIFRCHDLCLLFVQMFIKQRYLCLKVFGFAQVGADIASQAALCQGHWKEMREHLKLSGGDEVTNLKFLCTYLLQNSSSPWLFLS